MAYTTCVKCGNSSFELKETTIRGAAYRLYFVQCSSCGGAVGVQEFNNVGAMIQTQNEALKRIAAALNTYVDLPTK